MKPTLSSSSVKPLPARILLLYLNVGQWTIGLRGPATGRGAIRLAFFTRVSWRRFFLIGWLNHVFTIRCQSLWKCPLGKMLLRFGAIFAVKSNIETLFILFSMGLGQVISTQTSTKIRPVCSLIVALNFEFSCYNKSYSLDQKMDRMSTGELSNMEFCANICNNVISSLEVRPENPLRDAKETVWVYKAYLKNFLKATKWFQNLETILSIAPQFGYREQWMQSNLIWATKKMVWKWKLIEYWGMWHGNLNSLIQHCLVKYHGHSSRQQFPFTDWPHVLS